MWFENGCVNLSLIDSLTTVEVAIGVAKRSVEVAAATPFQSADPPEH